MEIPLVTYATGTVLFLFGIVFGSFLNVLSDRLSNEEGIGGRSHCDSCKKTLQWYELIPLVSFLIQGGKCRTCKSKLSWYYPFSELVTGVVFVYAWTNFPVNFFNSISPRFSEILLSSTNLNVELIAIKLLFLAIICCGIVMFFADVKYFIIPDAIQIVFAVCVVVMIGIVTQSPFVVGYRIVAGLAVMVPMLLLYLITKGRGLGFGDVKLAFNIGLLLNMSFGFIALYIAFILGAVIGVFFLVLKKKGLRSKVPFGPYLLAGMFGVIFFFEQVSRYFMLYLSF